MGVLSSRFRVEPAGAPGSRRDRRPSCIRQAFAQADGRRHPGAVHGCGRKGQERPPRHADGHGRRRHRPLFEIPEVRRQPPRLGRPRPLHPVGGPRLDADLQPAAPDGLQGRDAGTAGKLPPVGLQDRRPPGIRPHRRRRDHHRPAGSGPGHLGRFRPGGAASGGALRQGSGRSPHLGRRRRRLPDGRRVARGHRPGRPPEAEQAVRPVGRQRNHHRRQGVAVGRHRPADALQGLRLGGPGLGDQAGQADADRLQDQDRQGRRHHGRQPQDPRRRPGRHRDRGDPSGAELALRAVRAAGRRAESLGQGRQAGRQGPQGLGRPSAEPRPTRRLHPRHGRRPAHRRLRSAGRQAEATGRRQARPGHAPVLGRGAGDGVQRHPGNGRRLGRPDRLEQHLRQEHPDHGRAGLRRPLPELRHPRVRHGCGDERSGVARRGHPLRRHLHGVRGLQPPGDPPGRADGRARDPRHDPRLHRPGRRRPDPPAGRASGRPARHSEPADHAPGGHGRGAGVLAGRPAAQDHADRHVPVAPEDPGRASEGRQRRSESHPVRHRHRGRPGPEGRRDAGGRRRAHPRGVGPLLRPVRAAAQGLSGRRHRPRHRPRRRRGRHQAGLGALHRRGRRLRRHVVLRRLGPGRSPLPRVRHHRRGRGRGRQGAALRLVDGGRRACLRRDNRPHGGRDARCHRPVLRPALRRHEPDARDQRLAAARLCAKPSDLSRPLRPRRRTGSGLSPHLGHRPTGDHCRHDARRDRRGHRLDRHAAYRPRHARHAAGLGRAGQGGGNRAATPRRRGDRGRSLRQRPRHAGGAPQPRHPHDRPSGVERDRHGRGPAHHRAGDRGHRHRRPGGYRGGGAGPRHPHGPRHPADHEPRGHPPSGRRRAGPADQPLRLRRLGRGTGGGRRGRGLPLLRQAGDVVLRQGPVLCRRPRGPADHERGRAESGAGHRGQGHGRLGRPRRVRRRAVREGRRGVVQRSVAAPARHRPGDAGDAGPERVRPARPRHPEPARGRFLTRTRRQRRHLRRHGGAGRGVRGRGRGPVGPDRRPAPGPKKAKGRTQSTRRTVRHGQAQDGADIRRHRHIGGRVPRRHRPASGRKHQRRLDRGRGAVRLRHRLPLLRPLSGREGAGAERAQAHARRAAQRRAGLRPDAPRAGAGGADGLSARRAVDPGRRRSGGGGAGHDRPVHVDPPRRPVAGRHGPHRDGPHPRRHRPGRGADDHGHHPGRIGADCGQGAGREPLGYLHRRGHHSHRRLHGPVHPLSAPRPRGRGVGDRRGAAGPGHHRRGPYRGGSVLGSGLHPVRHDAGAGHDGLWLHRLGHSGVAAASPARLPVHLPEDRRHRRPGCRHIDRAPAHPDARHHPLHRRHRTGLLGRPVPLPVHHHRLRGCVGLPRPDLVRHHAQAAGEREPDPADRLRRHAV
uniref:LigA n=1 Tax=Parastrongyloides trichosuri TaxID=131310 RepID=A0A0N4ZCV8_PARTI